MKNGTAKISCKCANEFQDKHYGKGVRVANATSKQIQDKAVVRCTVCCSEHTVNLASIKN
jgi:hypothetical protein